MKSDEYFQKHGGTLHAFLESDAGKDLLIVLQEMRPNLVPNQIEHLIVEQSGALRGYEQCIKNLRFLVVPKITTANATPHYGNPQPSEPPPYNGENFSIPKNITT